MEIVQEHVRVVVQNLNAEILLLRRSVANKRAVGLWELPGGKTDSEAPYSAAMRELQEETAIKADQLELIGDVAEPIEENLTFHTTIYCVAPKKYAVKLSPEHDEWQWFSLYDLHHNMLAKNSEKIVQEIVLPKLTDEG